MTPTPAVPTEVRAPIPAQPSSAAAAESSSTIASLRVSIPDDAALLVGEFDTQSSGTIRYFQSLPLVPSKSYAYELCAELHRDGQVYRETKTIVVKAGEALDVDFSLDATRVAHAVER